MKHSTSSITGPKLSLSFFCLFFACILYMQMTVRGKSTLAYCLIETTYYALFLSCCVLWIVNRIFKEHSELTKIEKLFGIQAASYILIFSSFYITAFLGVPDFNLIGIWLFATIDIFVSVIFFVILTKAVMAAPPSTLFTWPNTLFSSEIICTALYLPLKITNTLIFISNIPL